MLATAGSMLLLNAMAAPVPTGHASSPSQLLVLGMHHSGTSVVSNLTMMMGAYGGETDELLLHPENPLKFWERRDVVALDEQRLVAGVQSAISSRYEVPDWVAYGFDTAKAATRVHEQAAAKTIVDKLNTRRPWVTKDPRMCLVAEEWMPLLDAPACVIVHREPLSVANSMMIYSHNVSLAEWASVYESYYTNAMRACAGVRFAHTLLWPPPKTCPLRPKVPPVPFRRRPRPRQPRRAQALPPSPPTHLRPLVAPSVRLCPLSPSISPTKGYSALARLDNLADPRPPPPPPPRGRACAPFALCAQKPTVVVQHSELVSSPYKAVQRLHADLTAAGVAGLTLPTEAQVSRLIKPSAASTPPSRLETELRGGAGGD